MKARYRAVCLAAALSLASLAGAKAAVSPSCVYQCRNTTTGQFITRTESASFTACCGGVGLPCPPGTVYYQTIGWGGKFCRP